ncbi:FAD-dependent oxidoreductase [Amycolatopsis pigmentata]|uniref:ferredoxin--NADP(+) reductase n=1 Tax=Amycolatopsis pigmentata TaxID=450801 RepID=A0ABW5FZA8_9PSEU
MAYSITQTCCADASCVSVCPVNCIHPTPDEPDFGTTDMLYIDPSTCIDCGACTDACPVDAIFPADELTGPLRIYPEINAGFFDGKDGGSGDPAPNFHEWGPPVFSRVIPSDLPALKVAVVGTGPAGMYAVRDLLLHTDFRVTLIDRLPVPGGLVRYGVAPDHPATKKIGETFARFHAHPRVRLRLGLQVGRDVTTADLAAQHDAVIYAVGASADRRLGIPGEDLPGSTSATSVVAWYNGHPEATAETIDLSGERLAVVGNGNVALDVARVLLSDPDALASTSISPDALSRLRSSRLREIVMLARRGPEDAACTPSELRALIQHEDIELVVDADSWPVDTAFASEQGKLLRSLRRERVDYAGSPRSDRRRIVLRFNSAPTRVVGDDRVRGVRVTGDGGEVEISTGGVVRAIGYRGRPVPGLPFDEHTGTVPNTGGRVDGVPGAYVVGWIKRGPSGGIGANRRCAEETVGALLDDIASGVFTHGGASCFRRKSFLGR